MVLALAVVVAVAGATAFVLSLPPPVSIHEGLTEVAFLANFPTTQSSSNPAEANFTATTFANETPGPSSSLTLIVHAYGAAAGFNWVIQGVQMFYDVEVVGRFAANLHVDGVRFDFNQTAPGAPVEFWNGPNVASSYIGAQGPQTNVSEDLQQAFGATEDGSGSLTGTLTNGGGPGPVYVFRYWANGESYMEYQTPKFLQFGATVTGWMLPPIRVSVGMEIRNVPKTFALFSSGTSWSVLGYNSTAWSVPTTAPFVVAGAINASGPVTAFIVNLTQWPGWYGPDGPTTWEWMSNLGTTPTPFNVTLPPPGGPPGTEFYFVFTTPSGSPGVTVDVTRGIVATT